MFGARKLEVVLEPGRLQMRMTESSSFPSESPRIRRFQAWIITRLSWLSLGLGIASYVQSL